MSKRKNKINKKTKKNKFIAPILFVLLVIISIALVLIFGNLFNSEKIIKTYTKKGAVVSSNPDKIIIDDEGTTYKFLINANTKFIGNNEEKLGSVIEITYDEDYSKDENAVLIDTKEKVVTDENIQPQESDKKLNSLIGTLRYDENNEIRFESLEDGKIFYITTDNKTNKEKNITLGTNIEVFYKGDFKKGIIASDIKLANI